MSKPAPSLLVAVFAALALAAAPARAQREGLLQIGDGLTEFLQRQQAAGRLGGAFVDALPLSAYEARRLLDTLAAADSALAPTERALLARYRGDAPAPGAAWAARRVPGLYRDGRALLSVSGDGYALEAEPLAYLAVGGARRTATDGLDPTAPAWQNTRGVRVAGHIGRHLWFESRLEENQRRPATLAYADGTAPRLGDVKLPGGATYDYWRATGVAGYRDRFVEVRFGRDRNRWGFGANSLILSDYATAYDQLQIRTRVWRLEYTNLFLRRSDPTGRAEGDLLYPSSYAAFHRLALDLPGRVQAELFEGTAFADDTTSGNRSGFELAYLNPVILYRSVEVDIGSPDNVMLGAGLAWTALRARRPGAPGLRLHGQLLLDELKVSELFGDWWGNKFGVAGGLHLVDPGVRGLDVRVEAARLRPYLYSHRARGTAFVHFNDGLGHAAGPNAQDLSLLARYRPTPRLTAGLNLAHTRRGRNTAAENFGADPRVSYESRIADYGIRTLQGVRQTQLLAEARLGYELLPELVLEAALVGERLDDALAGRRQAATGLLQLRWGLPFRSERF